ncbi:ATP-binding protein [Halobacteriovorax sp. JY17]|uniref:ATP-binding protein n=1 Tax=Halobacteriovorax sp. JY17 TaxID=2014617 RepID=UPI000C3516C2|nr:ATP-binding protein [Halobacteriovorax sp. JY17]PIK14396.1 MAG: hypothetical protein CES88_08620 [Halobacteriovorax sp. JY17]
MLFGEDFLLDHAKNMVTNPKVAMMELIANSSDAGALVVKITWPEKEKELLKIEDNGIGLTFEEFEERWETLSYKRRKNLGNDVIFPEDIPSPHPIRKLFGKSGKGRHSSFCFAESYKVITKKNGLLNEFIVKKSGTSERPFDIQNVQKNIKTDGHGTTIELVAEKGIISIEDLKDIIGSKFLMDPSFDIFINNEKIIFDDLSTFHSDKIDIPDLGTLEVIFIDSTLSERSSRLRGLVWWVHNRMVSDPSWTNLITGKNHLDGRSKSAKKYGFVIKANFLDEQVESDWQGFQDTEATRIVGKAVDDYITNKIDELLFTTREDARKEIISSNKSVITELGLVSQVRVVDFIKQLQADCPSMKQDDLINASKIFANLEKSRHGYDLLRQLSQCSVNELDRWNTIISKWDSRWAEIVLDELDSRIKLINEMEKLVHDKKTDELHELQPLFEKGLWIFGPQYESIEYQSNRTLKNIVDNFLAGDSTKLQAAKRRPDLLTSPVGAWESSRYGEDGEIIGADKVLIVELKKGGFDIKQKEIDQARDYALELKRSSAIDDSTFVECFVLGSTKDRFAVEAKLDDLKIKIVPKTYENVLRQANARLFNLRKKIESIAQISMPDEIKEVVSQAELPLGV